MSQRSEPGDSSVHSSRGSLYSGGPSRPSYTRTMSNTEYGGTGSGQISRTLPFRRSLKTYDRSATSGSSLGLGGDYSTMDSMVGAVRGLGQSLIDSPATFDPDSYLRQLRSMSRDRECSVSRMSSISEQDPNPLLINSDASGWSNTSGVGCCSQSMSPSQSAISNLEEQEGKMSIQEKMNNYQQYYQNLTSQSPLRRFQLTNPSQIQQNTNTNINTSGNNATGSVINPLSPQSLPGSSSSQGIGLARLRPNTMYETSFVDNQNQTPTQTPIMTQNTVREQNVPTVKPEVKIQEKHLATRRTPAREIPSSSNAMSPNVSVAGNSNINANNQMSPNAPEVEDQSKRASLTSGIPKWPGVSIQQYRPLSISSFPEGSRAGPNSSVIRVMSPPPTGKEEIAPPPQPQSLSPPGKPYEETQIPKGKKKEPARATSVERITRFLERKSVPREMTPGPAPVPPNRPLSPTPLVVENQNASNSSKISKPKFLQSLEKKWEKLTTSGGGSKSPITVTSDLNDPNEIKASELEGQRALSPPPLEPPIQNDEPISLEEDNKISESVLLRRAVSPEKKLKKFGSGTVNFMLGKFKKFEEGPPPSLAPGSKISVGKPPLPGNPVTANASPSRIGRRVQSVYAGAASDSSLILPPQQHLKNRPVVTSSPLAPPEIPPPVLEPSTSSTCNSPPIPNPKPIQNNNETLEPDAELIRAAEMAQQKRRSLRVESRTPTLATSAPSSIPGPTQQQQQQQKAQRPVSLGIFSPSSNNPESHQNSNKVQSLIPRANINCNGHGSMRSNSNQNLDSLSPPPHASVAEPITMKSMSPPQITIHDEQISSRNCEEGVGGAGTTSPLSPISHSDSFDSSSICSEKGEKGPSILDEEESVSDRIFRKSFYSRFNSIDRAKRSSSLNAAGAARKNLQPQQRNPSGSKTISSLAPLHPGGKAQSVDRTLSPVNNINKPSRRDSLSPRRVISPGLGPSGDPSGSKSETGSERPVSPGNSLLINKYNPNPLFKELITDDFKSNIEKKTEYSRRVTSKLSKLLRDIESDLSSCSLTKKQEEIDNGLPDFQTGSNNTNTTNGHKTGSSIGVGLKALAINNQHTNNHNLNSSHQHNVHKNTADMLLNNRRNDLCRRDREGSLPVHMISPPPTCNSQNHNNDNTER